jgi:hypothetical protein
MVGSGRRKVGAALLLGLLAAAGIAEARDRREQVTTAQVGGLQPAARPGSTLAASSSMKLGDLRLPPPGYIDYCLRYRGIDQGCR